jgi:steroid delta-isomerase-like uncharacterized protein
MNHEETIRNLFEAANRKDLQAVAESYAPLAVAHDPGYPKPLTGREAIRKDFEAFFLKGMPDAKMNIISMMSKSSTVVAECAFKGTHTGPLETPDGTVPATNKQIELRIAIFYAGFNEKGQITEERRYYDMAGLMRQLGLMK